MDDRLALLRDIHLPLDPVPVWAWVLIAACAGLSVGLAARFVYRRRTRLRRAALYALDAALQPGAASDAGLAAEVNRVLKVVARTRFPGQAEILHGEAWLGFLDARTGGRAFRDGPGRVLALHPYRSEPVPDPEGLVMAARDWVRRCA